MDSHQMTLILIFIVLIILSGLFSCAETAFTAISKIRLKTLAEENNRKAKTALSMLEDSDQLISAILVGNNLVNIAASSLTTSFVISIFGNEGKGVAIATGFVTLIILIFGEISPKTLANNNAEKVVLGLTPFIHIVYIICLPIVKILTALSHFLIKIFGGDTENGPTVTEEDLKTSITVSHEEGVLEDDEKEMLHNIFDFSDTQIKEMMQPRINVEMLPDDIAYDELLTVLQDSQYSRFPVYKENNKDEILGVFNIKDLLTKKVKNVHFDINNYLREPYFVYEFNNVSDAFIGMRNNHISLAVVLDEYGVMSGIVTIEDIVEEIVGDINDEYDDEEEDVVELTDHEYLLDGTLAIDEVNEECGTHFDSDDFESIGGLILGEVNGIPKKHMKITIDNCIFTIEKIDRNRIELLKLTIKPLEEEE